MTSGDSKLKSMVFFSLNLTLDQDFNVKNMNKRNRNKTSVSLLDGVRFFCVFCLVQVIFAIDSTAQEDLNLDFKRPFEEQLIPLDDIINAAIEYSPTLFYQDALIEKGKYQIELTKRLWQNNIFGFGNYSGGDQRILTGDVFNPDGVSTSSITNGYRLGLQVNIPLFEFIGRSSRIKVHEEEQKATVFKKEEMELEIKQMVIQEYFRLVGAFENLKIRSEGQEAIKTHYLVAEQEFKDGIIPIGELSRVTDVMSQSRAYYEQAKFEFLERIYNLAAYTGKQPSGLLK